MEKPEQIAEYIEQLATELSALAVSGGLPKLAYILSIAAAEAITRKKRPHDQSSQGYREH